MKQWEETLHEKHIIVLGGSPALGLSLGSIVGHAIETLTENLALELAPIRVNAIACGFVDTPLSAALLGEGLQARREALEWTLPIHRVVQPEDVAKLAIHVMLNTAITGATYAIDGGKACSEPFTPGKVSMSPASSHVRERREGLSE